MPKKTTILIIILAAVTGILLFLAVSEGGKPQSQETSTAPTLKEVPKTATILFSPQTIDLSSGTATPTSSVDILIDTGGSEVVGAQLEMQYDPKSLSNVRLIPGNDANSFFGPNVVILFNDVNLTTGRISFAIAIPPQETTKKGIGRIASLNFSRAFNAQGTTTISFLDKTLVTILGEDESILKETVPLNIILTQTQQFVPPPTTSPIQ
jgi:hypothetical protein